MGFQRLMNFCDAQGFSKTHLAIFEKQAISALWTLRNHSRVFSQFSSVKGQVSEGHKPGSKTQTVIKAQSTARCKTLSADFAQKQSCRLFEQNSVHVAHICLVDHVNLKMSTDIAFLGVLACKIRIADKNFATVQQQQKTPTHQQKEMHHT